ncbi:MAG: hypothetical protein R3C19_25525 [Planctomycetaceae bacterium]
MKVEDCIVSVERRSLGGCLDLAFVFARHFAAPIARLTLMFAIPSCALVWLLTSRATDMLIPSILIFLFFNADERCFGGQYRTAGLRRSDHDIRRAEGSAQPVVFVSVSDSGCPVSADLHRVLHGAAVGVCHGILRTSAGSHAAGTHSVQPGHSAAVVAG